MWLLFLLGNFSLLAMESKNYEEQLRKAGFDPHSPTTKRILQAIIDTKDEAIRKDLFGSHEELSALIEQNAQEISIVPATKTQQDHLLSEALNVCFEALKAIYPDKKIKKLDLNIAISQGVFFMPFNNDLTEEIFGKLTPINLATITSGANADTNKLLNDYRDILISVYDVGIEKDQNLAKGIKQLNKLNKKNNKRHPEKK
jgi:hypothetical protein